MYLKNLSKCLKYICWISGGLYGNEKVEFLGKNQRQMPGFSYRSLKIEGKFRKPASFTESSHVCLSSYYIPHYLIIPYTIFFGLNSSINKGQKN